jgi:LUC7 N_terminus
MATEEAKAMLDALMGADRNAPLPKGAAVPTKSNNSNKRDRSGGLVLPGKRHKSCYDKDIDPLYTAWGIDVYELFVNTKSDIGANPYIVDEGAKEEFRKLPLHEQERLGFHYFLFQKLSELVRQCDRTVSRNKELSQRGGQDFVEDVDDAAVDMLANGMVQLEDMFVDLNKKLKALEILVKDEEEGKRNLEALLGKARNTKSENLRTENLNVDKDATDDKVSEQETTELPSTEAGDDRNDLKEGERKDGDQKIKEECDESFGEIDRSNLDRIQMDLGKLTLQRQRILYDIGNLLTQIAPLQDSVETQRRQLNYVRSDISTDKTVCEVSGNFMSARDADERIAAHYAGKQYVGWKLVRDKLASMIKAYGPYGPPPPGRGPPNNSGPPAPRQPPSFNGNNQGPRGSAGGGRFDRPGSGNRAHQDRGPPERGRWERGAPQGYSDRGPRGPPQRNDWRR